MCSSLTSWSRWLYSETYIPQLESIEKQSASKLSFGLPNSNVTFFISWSNLYLYRTDTAIFILTCFIFFPEPSACFCHNFWVSKTEFDFDIELKTPHPGWSMRWKRTSARNSRCGRRRVIGQCDRHDFLHVWRVVRLVCLRRHLRLGNQKKEQNGQIQKWFSCLRRNNAEGNLQRQWSVRAQQRRHGVFLFRWAFNKIFAVRRLSL